ncbi:MAG: ribulose-phosphate 3-epimerase [Lachnospiraceae bacterium]|nr:ribulose-phosphate 3-epimerase [Lachnospiraceae bacterium]MCI5586755.1 ribulose-phosphate 3-epimerase [Lachnospiraceae bacterium]
MKRLAPSILAADFNHLGDDIRKVEDEGVRVLHLDVMDGRFVPSISFGMPLISSIRKESEMFFDVHLMIEEPIRYIKEFAESGADGITVHIEACSDIKSTIEEIKKYGKKAAVSINPGTPVSKIEDILEDVDMVLVMSVNPGFGGQKFIDSTIDKVEKLDKIRKDKDLDYKIEIDGGINIENIGYVIEKGVDIAVAGTAVFRGNISENVRKLKEVMASAS